MPNVLRPENELHPAHDRGLAAAAGASDGVPPPSGFDVGVAAAAVVDAAAQPVDAARDPNAAYAYDPSAPALGIADDGGSTSPWELGGPSAPRTDPAAPGLPDGWPGTEDATRIDDLSLESGGSFADAGELSEPEVLDVLEDDILDVGAEVVSVDEVELVAAPPPAPEAAPAPATDPAAFVTGKHRVVVHTEDGQVKRGAMMDAALDGAEVVIETQAGSGHEAIPSNRITAIFFMLPTAESPLLPQGRRVHVTFRDGRQVAGFSSDYDPNRVGFFMVPADTRTHTARIWVYQSAVRQVAVS
jgi:hypothetical protein